MKTFQRLFGILLVVTASAGLIVACGDDPADSCISSDDCAADERCNLETETCAFACTETADCIEGEETCEDVGDGGGVCVLTSEPANNGVECTEDAECDTANGETCDPDTNMCVGGDTTECVDNEDCDTAAGEFCNPDGECESTETNTYFFANIEDVTTEQTQCVDQNTDTAQNDPGSDIFGVSLTKEIDNSQYWGRFMSDAGIKLTDDEGNDNSVASPAGVLTGELPGLDADNCPEGSFDESVVALGCGGNVIVEFIEILEDGTENRIEINDGDTITVHEYGAFCGDADPEDPQDHFELVICDASENEVLGNTCNPVEASRVAGTGVSDIPVVLGE